MPVSTVGLVGKQHECMLCKKTRLIVVITLLLYGLYTKS